MASQAEGLQRLVGFFTVRDDGRGRAHSLADAAPATLPPAAPAAPKPAPALPERKANGATQDGGYRRF
jgi:hypothetical protein